MNMYDKNLESIHQPNIREQFLKEHSLSLPNHNHSRIDIYKKYSKTANKTLTNFANEMSELLKESMEHMDCLNLMVRGVCDNTLKHPNQQPFTQNQNKYQEGDRGGLLKYKHVLKQNIHVPIPAYSTINTTINQESSNREESQLLVRKINQQLAQKLHDIKQSGDSNKKIIGVNKNPSVVHFEVKRNKTNESLTSLRYNQEKTVMEAIKKQHKLLSTNDKKSSSKAELDGSVSENLETRTKTKRLKKYKRKVNRKPPKVVIETLAKPVIVNNNTDKNIQLNDSHMEVKGRTKYTKLSRKYANENFHNISSKEPVPTEGDQYGGKKIKIQSDNKQDWSVIMHTQKTTKPDSKINTSRVVNILDTITLKDLEPLKAEYPRKDHITESAIKIDNSLLYNLVTGNTKSLELLVDISNLQTNKTKTTPTLLSANCSVIDEMESLKKFKMFSSQPKGVALKEVKHKIKKRKASKEKKENEKSHKTSISMKEYQMYRQLTGKDTKTKLKKYMTDPVRSYNQRIIAMPILVDFDKEPLADISEVNSKETIVPEDILKPYIYTNVAAPISKAPTAVMTMTVSNVDEMNKRLLEPNKPVVKAAAEPSVLVQRVINCKQPKAIKSPKYTTKSASSDSSQLISFIVKKEKQSTVDTLFTPTKGSCNRKSSASERKVSPKRTIKTKTETKTSNLKAAIDGMERKLKEIIDKPEMRNSTNMQNMEKDMKSILSQMQIEMDSPDFSVGSSSTNSSIYGLQRCRSLLKSKTNLEGRHKLNTSITNTQLKKSRPQSIKSIQQSTSTSATSYTTYKESTSKLVKTLEDQKPRTKSISKEIKLIADKKSIPERIKVKQLPMRQESVKELKHKPDQLYLENITSLIEIKKPPKSPRRSQELHVIMAPERDYNNSKKTKVEQQDLMYPSIKFTSSHTDISIPKKVSSEKHPDLNTIFTKNEKKKQIEVTKNLKIESKQIEKEVEIKQPKKDLTETHRQKRVNSKILDKWQTLEHPSMLKINNCVDANEIQDQKTLKKNQDFKNDMKLKTSDNLISKPQVTNNIESEVPENVLKTNVKEEIENNKKSNNKTTHSNVSDYRITPKFNPDIENNTKQEILGPCPALNINEAVAKETIQDVFDQTIKPDIIQEAIREQDTGAMEQTILQKEGTVSKIRPETADIIFNSKKPVENIENVNTEKKLSKLQRTLEEESKGLCNDVNQVLHKIQEHNYVQLNFQKITNSNASIKMQRIRSEEFWTPFMQAVKKFRKEEPKENFYEFMKGKGHIRGSTELIRHKASVNCIASEFYISQQKMQVTCKNWTDSDLNVQKCDTDSSPEHSLHATPTKKCLRRMTYHERLSEIAKRKLDLIKMEQCKVNQFHQEDVLTQTVEPDMKSKPVQLDENNLQNVIYKMVRDSDIQPALYNPESFNYDKFLTCIYGLMFMTIFCGLNLKYACT